MALIASGVAKTIISDPRITIASHATAMRLVIILNTIFLNNITIV